MHPDDEFVEDNRERSPASEQDDTASPTPDGEQSQSDLDPAADETFDSSPEITSEVSSEDLVAEEKGVPEGPTLPQSDAEAPETLTDVSAPQDAAVTSEPAGDASLSGIQQIDWSDWVSVPGRVDPYTGKMISSGHELHALIHGLRPVFQPDNAEPATDQLPEPPPFARRIGIHPVHPASGDDNASGGTSPTVSVNVEVSFTEEALGQLYKGGIRHAAQFSRDELLIVARRLQQLDDEVYAREQQRRVLARQY